jgi:hypothetical protein
MSVHLKAWGIGCLVGVAALGAFLLPVSWVFPVLVLAPGVSIAVLLHTPDIHGGMGFIRVVLIANFVAYSLVASAIAELLIHWRRRY